MSLRVNLAALYTLNGNSHDTVAGNNGTDTSVTYSTGILNQCAVLSGDPSKILITSNSAINNWTTFSINLWFKTGAAMGMFTRLIEKGANNEITVAINYGSVNGKITLQTIGTTSAALTSNIAVNDGNWHMLTVTINSDFTACKMYIDGSLANGASGSAAGSSPTKTGNVSIGAYGGGTGFNWQGSIEYVHLYTKELTASEVTSLYNSGSPLPFPFIVNDSKPSGSYTDDSIPSPFAIYGIAKYGLSRYSTGSNYSNDSKPSGSYTNDSKP